MIAAVLIVVLEVTVFNFSFWQGTFNNLTGTTSSATYSLNSPIVSLGSGLRHSSNDASKGVVTVTNASKAYLDIELPVSLTVSNIRINANTQKAENARWTYKSDSHSNKTTNLASSVFQTDDSDYTSSALENVTIRIDTKSHRTSQTFTTGIATSYSPFVSSSTYIKAGNSSTATAIRIYFQEAVGSHIPLSSITVNAQIPFHFNIIRVMLLALVAIFLIALRPRSSLYSIHLNTQSRAQRLIFWMGIVLPLVLIVVVTGFIVGWAQGNATYHDSGQYTYNFNQYQLAAQALLEGHPWLDLKVAPQLAALSHAQSIPARAQLIAHNVTVYWDYAFYHGHYYSYFGVVPAVLIFMPFQMVTSLFHKGGLWLNTSMAIIVLLALALIFGILAIVRFLQRHFPGISIGQTILILLATVIGFNVVSLIANPNFYCIPFASATTLLALGFWLWMGAQRTYDPELNRWRPWVVTDGNNASHINAQSQHTRTMLSYIRMGAGSLCLALTLGCRPTFILCAALVVPLFIEALIWVWHEHGSAWHLSTIWHWIRVTLVSIVPALIAFIPLLAYNKWRFGSYFDFGSKYQLTVVDLTTYTAPLSAVKQIALNYLFLPLQFVQHFPFISSPTTRIVPWQHSEPMIAGLFIFAPLTIAIICIVVPGIIRQLHKSHAVLTTIIAIMMGALTCVLVAYMGGQVWRYINDFSWFFTIASIAIIAVITQWALSKSAVLIDKDNQTWVTRARIRLTRFSASLILWIVICAVLYSLIIGLASFFVTNRTASIVNFAPQVYYLAASIFSI